MVKDRAAIIAPPPLLTLLCIAAGFVAAHFKPLPIFAGFASARVAASIAIFLLAALVIFLALVQLITHKEEPSPYKPTHAIVGSGIYRVTRNPIYVGFLLVALGTAVAANSVWLLLAFVVLFVLLDFGVVRAEERYLAGKFGGEYEAYRGRVRRWI
ncbi:MAG: isoprenylcysteine carboxylmethyltransferase family protein [Acidobacteriota bacterium]|nr:isoprenylcysteine carboxylmethyltransferase family protein [Acidobacteriota bacterium]